MSLIRLQNLVIGYKTEPISTALSVELPPKQVICLLGANGCGKTTLLKTILGLLKPIQGEIFIDDKNQAQWTRKQLAQFIGYVPQAHHSLFPFSVEEVVLMGRTAYLDWYRSPHIQDIDIAVDSLKTLGIEHLRKRIYTQLSGGERQLVLLARALAQQPHCLIMDEPTSSLDFGNQLRVLEYIDKLRNTGLSILFTTHQPEQAKQTADQVMLFHQGRIIAQGKPQMVMTLNNLALIYHLDPAVLQKNLSFLNERRKYEDY